METILWVVAGLFGLILYLSIGSGLVPIFKAIRKDAEKNGWALTFKGIKITEKNLSWSSAWVHSLLWPLDMAALIMAALTAIAGAAFVIAAVFVIIIGVVGLVFFVAISALLAILALIYLVCSVVFSGASIAFAIIAFMALCVVIACLLFFLISGILSIPETTGNLLTKGAPVSYEKKEDPESTDDSFFQDPPSSRVAE